ncbi:Oidioi.mRNA.OKI2018_I69.chr2.g4030.t1.cds [Oikopleura dioica]|uniref:Oidioi.mRNA.OKI2018_I69.chr2.g4030.t1.cds n=1 Tax=Oikopleura dioica TaxID=34765 RepID=A0ABN7SZJ4_OIKDI|nr:Oidioi.mRNA.OKI2018_I69.chr2.g4030.t1.cds [Oikopleura dioica]
MMFLRVILFSLTSAMVIRTSDLPNSQPDESWFRTGRSAEPSYRPSRRMNSQPQRFSRFTPDEITLEECYEIIKSEFLQGSYENPLEECEGIHRMMLKIITDRL